MIKIVRTSEPIIARSASLFWWKRIYFGSKFGRLTIDEKEAVIAHELGHCHGHHMEQRILMLLFPWGFKWLCHRQEFQADRYAADYGHGVVLAKLISRVDSIGRLHPPVAQRLASLERHTLRANPAPLA